MGKVSAGPAVVAASVVAVTGIIVGTSLLGSTSDDVDSGSPVSSVEPWAARARGTFAAWAGTADEQQAAEVVVAYALNGAYSDCMSEKGHSRPWQGSISPAPVYADPLIYSYWAASRLDGYYSHKVINGEIGQRMERAANAVNAQGEEAEAELACRTKNPAASDAEVSDTRSPEIARELLSAWADALAPVVVAGGDFESYDACIRRTGVLDELAVGSVEKAREMLSSLLPVGSVPLGDEPSTPEWDQYLAKERAWVDADWSCRESVRATLGESVEQALDAFESEHADEIDEARSAWDEVVKQATALGWSPDDRLATHLRAVPSRQRRG